MAVCPPSEEHSPASRTSTSVLRHATPHPTCLDAVIDSVRLHRAAQAHVCTQVQGAGHATLTSTVRWMWHVVAACTRRHAAKSHAKNKTASHPGIFVLVFPPLGFWGKTTTPYPGTMAYHWDFPSTTSILSTELGTAKNRAYCVLSVVSRTLKHTSNPLLLT